MSLAAVLISFAASVAWLQPRNFFALTEDDSIYMSSAKAMAQGEGYVLPNLPGTPPATKYPPLYSWLLSQIWRWNPTFPENISTAIALNVSFGFIFLTTAFLLLRTVGRLNDVEAVLVVAFCGLHYVVLFHTANVLAEIPFAAVLLGAILLADRAIEGKRQSLSAAFCGILSGLSVLLRITGAPISVALGLAILLKRGSRRSVVFGAAALPFFLIAIGRAFSGPLKHVALSGSTCDRVWNMTWLYYTSYVGYWKAEVLSNHVLWPMLKQNLLILLLQPGSYLIEPTSVHPGVLGFVGAMILSGAALRGVFQRKGEGGWHPLHWSLALYVVPLVFWDYPVMQRFLIPFLPFFVAGVWLEAKRLSGQVWASALKRAWSKDGFAIILLSTATVALAVGIGWSFCSGIAETRALSQERAQIGSEKREAYGWLNEHTAGDSRIVAYEDGALYLYSRRQAIRPVIFAPAGAFQGEQTNSELACLTEAGRRVRAGYWLIADDDFSFEWGRVTNRGRKAESEYASHLPLAFRSQQGRVRVYKLDAGGGTPLPSPP